MGSFQIRPTPTVATKCDKTLLVWIESLLGCGLRAFQKVRHYFVIENFQLFLLISKTFFEKTAKKSSFSLN